eukprot:scaffold378112_cov39-Prasinocladus_malaysianus.AAC.1
MAAVSHRLQLPLMARKSPPAGSRRTAAIAAGLNNGSPGVSTPQKPAADKPLDARNLRLGLPSK